RLCTRPSRQRQVRALLRRPYRSPGWRSARPASPDRPASSAIHRWSLRLPIPRAWGLSLQWPFEITLFQSQRFGDERLLLFGVAAGEAGRRRGRGLASGIARPHARMPGFAQSGFDPPFDEEPGAVVLRLLLAPDHFLEIGHARQTDRQRLARERIELLEPDHRHVFHLFLLTRFEQVVRDLARAQHEPADLVVGDVLAVGEDALEVAVR